MSEHDEPPPPLTKLLGDGREGTVHPMTYGKGRLCIGEPGALTYDEGYCYDSVTLARLALDVYEGRGEPVGWFKNLQTGEYQPEYTRQTIDPRFERIAPTSIHYGERGST